MADPLLQSNAAQLQRRNRELSILNTIAGALNRSVDLEAALQATLVQVADLLDLRTAWIWLLHETSGEPYLAAAQNLPPALAGNPARMEGSCYCLDTYRDGDLNGAANVNVVTCTRLKWLVDGTDGLRYHASIPLYAHGKQLGVLNVASPDWRELAADDLRLLYTVGDLLSIAVERARLFARSTQLGALEERNRLAREIHDTLAQGLTAIALQLESADALLEANAAPIRTRIAVGKALELARSNLEEARRSVLDLRAAPLEGRTLVQALADLAKTPIKGITITFTAAGAGRPLSPRVEVGLYRIVQEALNNATRHAQARTIAITLVTTPEAICCVIEDDGCGFDPATVTPGHYGLVGLSERARLLGGTLELHTSPGSGTRVAITIPLM
jgi:two-component system NarL family sensor kinase